jgi:hypothetical protein
MWGKFLSCKEEGEIEGTLEQNNKEGIWTP